MCRGVQCVSSHRVRTIRSVQMAVRCSRRFVIVQTTCRRCSDRDISHCIYVSLCPPPTYIRILLIIKLFRITKSLRRFVRFELLISCKQWIIFNLFRYLNFNLDFTIYPGCIFSLYIVEFIIISKAISFL